MLLQGMKQILQQMKSDPAISYELPEITSSIKRTFGWLVFFEIFFVLQVLPVKLFIDEISQDEPSLQAVALISLAMLVLYKTSKEIERQMSNQRNNVLWGCWRVWWGYGNLMLLRQSNDWHSKNSTGEKESLVNKNVSKFQHLFDEAMFNTLPVTLRIFFTNIFMFFIAWQLGVVALTVNIAFGIAVYMSEKGLSVTRKDFQERITEVEDNGSEINKNWSTIRALGLEEEFGEDNSQLLRRFWKDEYPRHQTYLRYILRQEDVVVVGRALLYLVAGYLVVSGKSITIGSLVLATTWMEKVFSNLGRYQGLQHQLNGGKEALRELSNFILLEPTVTSPKNPKQPKKQQGKVGFKNIVFGYEDCERHAICNFNLEVEANTSLALVGESGCGKSTLMSLLTRNYDPLSGAVEVDGVDLREYDHLHYRNQVTAVVSQHIELFNRSIADNIRLARPDATMEQVIEAAKLAGAHDFISDSENGYETHVGENGLKLSGGQRQRIAIARALIMEPKILILDEATSALDAKSQAEVQTTIEELISSRKCTIFIIAHRLSTVRNADQIAVMKQGKLVANGTHQQLLVDSVDYQELCSIELGEHS